MFWGQVVAIKTTHCFSRTFLQAEATRRWPTVRYSQLSVLLIETLLISLSSIVSISSRFSPPVAHCKAGPWLNLMGASPGIQSKNPELALQGELKAQNFQSDDTIRIAVLTTIVLDMGASHFPEPFFLARPPRLPALGFAEAELPLPNLAKSVRAWVGRGSGEGRTRCTGRATETGRLAWGAGPTHSSVARGRTWRMPRSRPWVCPPPPDHPPTRGPFPPLPPTWQRGCHGH